MLSWFRKRKADSQPGETVGNGKLDHEIEELKILEERIDNFKKRSAFFKENLQLLDSEIKRKDLSYLISLLSGDLDSILASLDDDQQNIRPYSEQDTAKYILNEELVKSEPYLNNSASLPEDREEELLNLSFQSEWEFENKEPVGHIRKRILLVEDNEDLRIFYRLALSAYYDILEANNGLEALNLAEQVNPDLIVSDLMMPEMDGIDFCKAIKGDINTNHIPFIILTAKDAVASRLEGTQSGADVYLSKPTSAELLQATIENIFSQRQKIKDYFSKKHYSEALSLVNSSKEQEFISKVIQTIEDNLTNENFEVDIVCRNLNLSRTKLYQKVKSLTGQSIIEFVRSYRLKRAKEIMTHEDVSLSEVIFRVGIQTPSYFTKAFKKEYGHTPTQFLDEIRAKR